ncbi:hypothetical protein [Billgrantia saliphila]|uniref:hypothetical protein n=1 Tax=Billgrantia saliphila TaxID=1848458 RepID=UPI000CE3CB39|nr:hypothetical protein [Halomonas saliphila]
MQVCTTRSASRSVSAWDSPAGNRQLTNRPASHQRERNRQRVTAPEGGLSVRWCVIGAAVMLSTNSERDRL